MAERLIPIRSALAPRHIAPPPGSEEYALQLDGMEPDVQLFGGAQEEKLAPNYSDWLRAREETVR